MSTQYELEDKANHAFLKEKWNKQSICIFSGKSWEKWSFKSLELGIGGSEVWQICLSRELDKLGFKVINFNDCEEDCQDGNIKYIHYSKFPEFIEYNWFDFFICSRTVEPFSLPIRAGKKFVMIHDVWLLSGKQVLYQDKIDGFCALSEWHKNFASDYHSISKEKFFLTSNGIDFSRFDDVKVHRNPYRLHWSSSWDRGLDNVLYLWPFIKKEIPEAELHCYYGTFNWKEACKKRNDQEGLKKIAELEEAAKQPGVFTYDRIGQKELAIEMCKASLLFYPSWFSETFFITGIECQYAGIPVICNNYAGVKTTLSDSAIMLGNGDPWWPYSKEGREKFLLKLISVLKNKEEWNYWSNKGKKNAQKYSWELVAKQWQRLFNQ